MPDAKPAPDAATPAPAPRRKSLFLLLFFALLPLPWLGSVLLGGRVLLPTPLLRQIAPWGAPAPNGSWNALTWDAAAFFYPIRSVAAQAIRHGHLPLWNPSILCGTPLLADAQSAILYPLNLLFWILPVERAFGASAYLHLLLAGVFVRLWLRREGVSEAGSLIGAASFAVGGWSAAWMDLPNFMATAVWIPLLLAALAGERRRRLLRASSGCAACIAMMLLGGHVQVAFYGLLGALASSLFRDLSERRLSRLPPLLIGSVVGAMIAAPQLLPSRALSAVSHRSTQATAEGYAGFVRQGLPPEHLAGVVAPDFFGNPGHGDYMGRGEYSETALYLGLLPLLLGVHALFGIRRNRAVGALALVAGIGLALALGTPLNAPLYFGVPGFARFGSPGRALVLFALAWSGLAALGWDRLMRRGDGDSGVDLPGWRKTLVAGGSVAILAILAGAFVYPAGARGAMLLLTGAPAILRAGLLFLLAALVPQLSRARSAARWLPAGAVALVLLDLWSSGAGYNLSGPASDLKPPDRFAKAAARVVKDGRIWAINPVWPTWKPPRAVLPPNLPALLGLPDVGGYEGAYLLDYKRQINAWEGRDASPETNGNMVMPTRLSSPMIRELAVRAVAIPRPLPPEIAQEAGLRYVDGDAGWSLYAVTNPSSRAEFYGSWPPLPGETGKPLPLSASWDDPNRVTIRLPGGAGCALLRDASAEGWAALADGKPVPASRTIFSPTARVVRVMAGEKTVTWEYRPPSLALGWKLLAAGLIALFAMIAGDAFVRRRERTTPAL